MIARIFLATILVGFVSSLQVTIHTPSTPLQAGTESTLTWSTTDDGPIPPNATGSLVLVKANGKMDNLTPVAVVASGLNPSTGQVKYTVPNTIINANDYALQWQWPGHDPNTWKYTGTFGIQGGTGRDSTFISATSTPTLSTSTPSLITTTTTPTGTTTSSVTLSRPTATATVNQTARPTSINNTSPSNNGGIKQFDGSVLSMAAFIGAGIAMAM